MIQWHRNAHGSIDRMLAEMTPAVVAQRIRGAACDTPPAALRDATLFALAGMSAAERDELAATLGMNTGPVPLGELFFEPASSVSAERVAERLRDGGEYGPEITSFLVHNPRALGSYQPDFAQHLLQLPPPKRRLHLPIPLAAAFVVFGIGAVIAGGALIIPQLDQNDDAPPAALAVPVAAATVEHPPAGRRNAPRQQHRQERRTSAPPPVQPAAQPAAAGPHVGYVAPPARQAQPRRAQTPNHHRQARHNPATHPRVVAATGPAPTTTPAAHITFWHRFFGWIHVRKKSNS